MPVRARGGRLYNTRTPQQHRCQCWQNSSQNQCWSPSLCRSGFSISLGRLFAAGCWTRMWEYGPQQWPLPGCVFAWWCGNKMRSGAKYDFATRLLSSLPSLQTLVTQAVVFPNRIIIQTDFPANLRPQLERAVQCSAPVILVSNSSCCQI